MLGGRARRSSHHVEPFPDVPTTPGRRIAWAVVIVLGCGFSYSIGWQRGWTEAASGADERIMQFGQSLRESRAAMPTPLPEPMLSDG